MKVLQTNFYYCYLLKQRMNLKKTSNAKTDVLLSEV